MLCITPLCDIYFFSLVLYDLEIKFFVRKKLLTSRVLFMIIVKAQRGEGGNAKKI